MAPRNAEDYAWAVYDGEIALIPIQSTLWLFGSGLLGLAGNARKKSAQLATTEKIH
jgi:hypothetical protein